MADFSADKAPSFWDREKERIEIRRKQERQTAEDKEQAKKSRRLLNSKAKIIETNFNRVGAEIPKLLAGIRKGQNPGLLLLQAVDIIAVMTGKPEIVDQYKEIFKSVYGVGLSDLAATDIQIKECSDRLEQLEANRESGTKSDQKRIKAAITETKKELHRLQSRQLLE